MRFVHIPAETLGREYDFGSTTVTAEMIAGHVEAVGDAAWRRPPPDAGRAVVEAPPTFCLSLCPAMRPAVELVGDVVAMYGGHDLHFLRPIRAGETYHVRARITDVYEKSGRSGVFNVVVREMVIRDSCGEPVVQLTERQVVRPRVQGDQ